MTFDQALAKYDRMCAAIAEFHRFDEVKVIRDKATALAAYAKQAGNFEAERQLAEIRVRAERRAGELLVAMEASGERAAAGDNLGAHRGQQRLSNGKTTLADLSITRDQSSIWQQLAAIPADTFETALTALASQKPVTAWSIVRLFEKVEPEFDWREHWKGMPEFVQENQMPARTIFVHFQRPEDVEVFSKLIGQKIGPKAKFVWYPEAEIAHVASMRWVDAPTQAPDDSDIELLDEGVEESAAEAC